MKTTMYLMIAVIFLAVLFGLFRTDEHVVNPYKIEEPSTVVEERYEEVYFDQKG